MVLVILLQLLTELEFDYNIIVKGIKYLFNKFTLRTCNNMTRTIVFTLQEHDVTAIKAGRNMTTYAQHRII